MREHTTHGKCSACGKTQMNHKLTTCDHCLRKFCDDHIYVGVDTGDYYLKNFCGECLELLNLPKEKERELVSASNKPHHYENKQINLSLLKKSKIEIEHSNNGNGSIKSKNEIVTNHISNPMNIREKWEYKSVFLAVDSDVEVDSQILDHIVEDYLNVFPVNRYIETDNKDEEVINIDKLNLLGDEGWEIVTSIPKTKSIMLVKKNGKPVSSTSANVSGAYIIMKRKKI